MKKLVALVGDYYHPADYLSKALTMLSQPDWQLEIYTRVTEVDWKHLPDYDLFMLATWGKVGPESDGEYWITEYQQQKIADFLAAGKKLFLLHSGIASYPRTGLLRKISGGHFVKHPSEEQELRVYKTMETEFTAGVSEFVIKDEQYFMEISADQITPFLAAESEKYGESIAGWFREYKSGQVFVLTPGHNLAVLENEMMQRLIKNIIKY